MSGTSMNGVDAALVSFKDGQLHRLMASHTEAYPAALRERLMTVAQQQPALTIGEMASLDAAVGEVFARAALGALGARDAGDIRAIGSHGQTVFHSPDANPGTSVQWGDPNRIAALTGIATVADFRRRDLALGGQGAPLVPAFHHAVFSSREEPRAILNVGGVANLTILPGTAEGVTGFDTGPGNGLMDEWASEHRGRPYDAEGAWGASGRIHEDLLAALLAQPYFHRAPPKSTGRGDFNLRHCRRAFPKLEALAPADVQRTFCELTARSAADAVVLHAPNTRRLLVCGGGVHNRLLMQRLTELLPQHGVESTDRHGLAADWVEATAFAWLAMRTLHGLPGNLPAVTGARAPAVLGGVYAAAI